jgi:two-component system CheB/CheR fusion protein
MSGDRETTGSDSTESERESEDAKQTGDTSTPAHIVGIGASAGGLEAFKKLIEHFELDQMAFVVVQHLSPKHTSILPELLQPSTLMRVVAAADGMRVVSNVIYVIPPGTALRLEDGVLRVAALEDSRGPRLTNRHLFPLARPQ